MNPVSISRYIALVTKDEQPKEVVSCWFDCIKTNGPTGVLMSFSQTDDQGIPRSVSLVHRVDGVEHQYIVPLSRDLEEEEGEAIVQAFAAEHPDLNFDVKASACAADQMDNGDTEITVNHDAYLSLCDAWAKRQHAQWVKERTEAGWKYGTNFSVREKTHPLIRPWDQLPDQFRKIDLEHPQMLLDLLNDQGYAVISRHELDSIMKLIRIADTN